MRRSLYVGQYTGEIVQKSTIDNIVVTNTIYGLNKNNPYWHCHENLHFCFVYQGGKAETKSSTKYTKQQGSIFFYHSEELHRWIPSSPISKSANIEVGKEFIDNYNLTEDKIKSAIEGNIDAKALILRIVKEMYNSDSESELSINSLLLELISNSHSTNNAQAPVWVRKIRELLHDECETSWSLTQLANTIGVHPVTISKNFRKHFNCTMGEYRRQLKVSKSLDLIKNTNTSLTEIALEGGFSDQSHFTRVFKKRTGFLPKEFRNI